MEENNKMLHDLREHYALIFNWHRKQGPSKYKDRFESQVHLDDKWYRKYLQFLEEMPQPHEADVEEIASVVHEVLTGCMERSYGVEVLPNVSMSTVAKAIKRMLKEIHEKGEREIVINRLKSLRNTGKDGGAPASVEVFVPTTAFYSSDHMYLEYAKMAYGDVPSPNNVTNLGGFVAVADTNIEVQSQHHKPRFDYSDKTRILFRNAKALHLAEDTSENSIVGLIKSGAISILSVKIGGSH